MRLLEFSQADISTDPHQSAQIAVQIKDLPGKPAIRIHPAQKPVNPGRSEARVFPIKDNPVRTPVTRGPIDLEMLQQRVATLEKRIKERAAKSPAPIATHELEQLKLRLQKLERNINSELWAARQREHTMLEMLAKPPLAARFGRRMTRFRTHNLPAIGHWLKEASIEWLQDRQPDWWPAFARAWKESLDRARGISTNR